MKFVNLTPHQIVIETIYGSRMVLPSEGVARVASKPGECLGNEDYVALYSSPSYGQVEGLPPPQDYTCYIVSAMVAARCVGRCDVFSPGTGPNDGAIRGNGQIVAVTRLIQAPQQ